MNTDIEKIDTDILDTIRVTLRLSIMEGWKYRRLAFSRQQLKNNLKALRVMRNTQILHQEKFLWAK